MIRRLQDFGEIWLRSANGHGLYFEWGLVPRPMRLPNWGMGATLLGTKYT